MIRPKLENANKELVSIYDANGHLSAENLLKKCGFKGEVSDELQSVVDTLNKGTKNGTITFYTDSLFVKENVDVKTGQKTEVLIAYPCKDVVNANIMVGGIQCMNDIGIALGNIPFKAGTHTAKFYIDEFKAGSFFVKFDEETQAYVSTAKTDPHFLISCHTWENAKGYINFQIDQIGAKLR